MEKFEKASYFPAVDGLRALAVLSVLLFHVNGLVPSGFVGVDVFFVISGFVVTLASTSLPRGKLSGFLLTFYGRRLQRIFPAAIVCLVITFALMVMFIPVAPDGRLTEANTKTGLAAFFGFGNVILAQSLGDYWSPRTELNPFTHTWSLGVEEQFYFIFPVLAFLWFARQRMLGPVLVVILCVISAVWACYASGAGPFAFYSLVTRFWELGIGVLLALAIDKWAPISERNPFGLSTILGSAGLFGILLAFWVSDRKEFPWPWAIIPVFSTAAVILAVASEVSVNPISRLLASKPMVWIGKRSFSLYLWHWPVIVLLRWTTGLESPVEVAFALAVSLALAGVSYGLVEQPIRSSTRLRTVSREKLVLSFLLMVVLTALFAGTLAFNRARLTLSVTSHPTSWRWDGTITGSNPACTTNRLTEAYGDGRLLRISPAPGCVIANRTLFVAGDSHAGAYVAMLDLFARERGWEVRIFSMPGCGVYDLRRTTAEVGLGCQRFVARVMKGIAGSARSGDVLFLPSLRLPRFADQWGPVKNRPATLTQSDQELRILEETIGGLGQVVKSGASIVFEAPKPVFKAPLFRCSDPFNRENPVCSSGFEVPRAEIDALRQPILRRMQKISETLSSVSTWDPIDLLCDQSQCSASLRGKPLFFDGDHISGFGNELLFPSFSMYMKNLGRS